MSGELLIASMEHLKARIGSQSAPIQNADVEQVFRHTEASALLVAEMLRAQAGTVGLTRH